MNFATARTEKCDKITPHGKIFPRRNAPLNCPDDLDLSLMTLMIFAQKKVKNPFLCDLMNACDVGILSKLLVFTSFQISQPVMRRSRELDHRRIKMNSVS